MKERKNVQLYILCLSLLINMKTEMLFNHPMPSPVLTMRSMSTTKAPRTQLEDGLR